MLVALALGTVSCVRPRNDERVVIYSVPGVSGPDCGKELLRVLSRVDGVVKTEGELDVVIDTTNRTVSVKYNSRVTAQKNIEHAIAAGGFDVEDTPANPTAKAKLPAPCQSS